MTRTTLMSASAAALILGAGNAMAVEQAVIDAIVADLSAQGFSRIEIDIERTRLDVDAYGGGQEGDFYYSLDGTLLWSQVKPDDSYATVPAGLVVGFDDSYDDDEDDDDDDDDDRDDDRDDDDRDDDRGGDDESDDDDGDDDESDDD